MLQPRSGKLANAAAARAPGLPTASGWQVWVKIAFGDGDRQRASPDAQADRDCSHSRSTSLSVRYSRCRYAALGWRRGSVRFTGYLQELFPGSKVVKIDIGLSERPAKKRPAAH